MCANAFDFPGTRQHLDLGAVRIAQHERSPCAGDKIKNASETLQVFQAKCMRPVLPEDPDILHGVRWIKVYEIASGDLRSHKVLEVIPAKVRPAEDLDGRE